MLLHQEDYDTIVFLTKLVYCDVDGFYPKPFDKVVTIEKFSGLRMNIFDMDDYNLVVICGTNSLRDWISNFKVAFGLTPNQYYDAYDYVIEQAWRKDTTKPIVVVGHSLGGGVAEFVASRINCTCITFNGCGSKHIVDKRYRDDFKCINLVTSRDILNGITRRIPFAKNYLQHCGETYIIRDTDGFFPLSVKSHSNFGCFSKVYIDELQ